MAYRLDPEDVGIVTSHEVLRGVRALECIFSSPHWHDQLTLETAIDAMYCLDRCTKQDIYKPKE